MFRFVKYLIDGCAAEIALVNSGKLISDSLTVCEASAPHIDVS